MEQRRGLVLPLFLNQVNDRQGRWARNAKFFAHPEQTNKALKLFWMGAGENDQTIFDGARRLDQTLTKRGIKHEYHKTTGGHTWINGRLYLRGFAQRLFR